MDSTSKNQSSLVSPSDTYTMEPSDTLSIEMITGSTKHSLTIYWLISSSLVLVNSLTRIIDHVCKTILYIYRVLYVSKSLKINNTNKYNIDYSSILNIPSNISLNRFNNPYSYNH